MDKFDAIVWGGFFIICIVAVLAFFIGAPIYGVWQQELQGQAELARAEYNKRIIVEEARAEMDSAGLYADAEIIRARGVAEANEIIGESLAGNEAYLRYLWIQGLHDGSSEIIYIPTEANLPILEASRMNDVGQ